MTLLEKTRKFYASGIIGDPDTNKCAEHLGKLFECDVIILNEKGGFWGVYYSKPISCTIIQEMLDRGVMDVSCMARINALTLGNISSSCFNPYCVFKSKKECPYSGEINYEIPAIAFNQRIGTVIFIRQKREFTDAEKAVLEMIVMTMAFEGLFWIEKRRNDEAIKKVKMENFIASISVTEKQALEAILEEMGGLKEKKIVMNKIAKKHDIARTIIATTLKKMQGAGFAEIISMGVAGTYIRLLEEVES